MFHNMKRKLAKAIGTGVVAGIVTAVVTMTFIQDPLIGTIIAGAMGFFAFSVITSLMWALTIAGEMDEMGVKF